MCMYFVLLLLRRFHPRVYVCCVVLHMCVRVCVSPSLYQRALDFPSFRLVFGAPVGRFGVFRFSRANLAHQVEEYLRKKKGRGTRGGVERARQTRAHERERAKGIKVCVRLRVFFS